MNANATHILREFPSKKCAQLIRKADCIIIALRNMNEVQWGESPAQRQHRQFLNEDYANRWLRKVASADQSAIKGLLCKRCGHVPSEEIVCAESNDGVHQIDYRTAAEIDTIDGEPRIKTLQ